MKTIFKNEKAESIQDSASYYQKVVRDAWKFKSILFVYSYFGASALLTIWGQRAPSFEGRYLTGSDFGIVIGGVLVGSLITFGVNRLYRTVFDEDKKKQESQGVQATEDF